MPLPTEGKISALSIPHSSIVFDLHRTAEIQAELLGGEGFAVVQVKHADLVSFTCLKALAFDQRFERKDAHNLIYCIQFAQEGPSDVVRMFREALKGRHGTVVRNCMSILRNRFAGNDIVEGYRKDGPVAVARFELGEGDGADQREARLLRQREASDVIEQLPAGIGV